MVREVRLGRGAWKDTTQLNQRFDGEMRTSHVTEIKTEITEVPEIDFFATIPSVLSGVLKIEPISFSSKADEEFEDDEDWELEDDYSYNMPCDNSGYCAGPSGCSQYWNCHNLK